MKKPEILAPAGSVAAMEAAIKAGADAVYMGGSMFGARAYADNPGQEELVDAIHYVHFYDKKLYLTLNTLLKEQEMELVGDYLLPYYKAGLDGIIIQDPGVFSFVKEYFPGLPLHASTQMNITGLSAARLLKRAGASRIVPARELSLLEIRKIKQETGLEIETFVHGALCYCYSGRCLMSSMLGGRSGNRGRCAQPCRLPYGVGGQNKSSHVLSPKDLCTVSMIPELVKAGIDSFKIEGRMKNPEYVASIVSVYKKYLDGFMKNPDRPFVVSEEDERILLEAYNRGGFTTGYYDRHNGPEMMSMDRPNHRGIPVGKIEKLQGGQISFHCQVPIHKGDVLEISVPGKESITLTSPTDCEKGQNISLKARQMKLLRTGVEILRTSNPWQKDKLAQDILLPVKKIKIRGKAEFKIGRPSLLHLSVADKPSQSICVQGDEVLLARERPLTKEQMKKPLLQTGTSRFEFEQLEISMEEGAFLPVGALKKLRREGLEKLQHDLEEKEDRSWQEKEWSLPEKGKEKPEEIVPFLAASAEDKDTLLFLMEQPEAELVYVPVEEFSSEERKNLMIRAKELKKQVFYALPRVFRNEQQEEYQVLFAEFEQENPTGFLIRNLDEFGFMVEMAGEKSGQKDWKLILDYSLYAYNRKAQMSYEQAFVDAGWEKENQKGKISFLKNGNRMELFYTLPMELNKKEMEQLPSISNEWIVYGRIPLMVSAQCVTKNTKGCVGKPGYEKMEDRYQKSFFVRRHCRHCYNTIWNGVPLSFHDKKDELLSMSPSILRLHFTIEKEDEIRKILHQFFQEWKGGKNREPFKGDFTRGHLKRGVE